MALKLPGHKRGRSSSTTTAIQRPCLTIPGRTMTSTLARRSSCDSFESGSTPRSTIDDPKERDRFPRQRQRSGWWGYISSYWQPAERSSDNVLFAENDFSSTSSNSNFNTPSSISSPHSPVSPVQHAVDWSAPLPAGDSRSVRVRVLVSTFCLFNFSHPSLIFFFHVFPTTELCSPAVRHPSIPGIYCPSYRLSVDPPNQFTDCRR